jgi:hypothetical protein
MKPRAACCFEVGELMQLREARDDVLRAKMLSYNLWAVILSLKPSGINTNWCRLMLGANALGTNTKKRGKDSPYKFGGIWAE